MMVDKKDDRKVEKRLEELGVTLPAPGVPVAAYVPSVRSGNLVFVSGQLPRVDGVILHGGVLDDEVSIEQGQQAARAAAINALAVLKDALGDLDRVKRIVRLNGYVAARAGFTGQSKVIDGASSFLQELFGEAGRHSRVAVGVASLPMNAAVEVDLIAEVED